jgi:hypothetical protein
MTEAIGGLDPKEIPGVNPFDVIECEEVYPQSGILSTVTAF